MLCSIITCRDTRNWFITHPKTAGFGIALIFALGVILVHFNFHTSMYWPIGLGITGFIATLLMIVVCNRLKIKYFYDLHQLDPNPNSEMLLKELEGEHPQAALKHVTKITLQICDANGNNPLHLVAQKIESANKHSINDWIRLLHTIFFTDQNLQSAPNKNGQTPLDLLRMSQIPLVAS